MWAAQPVTENKRQVPGTPRIGLAARATGHSQASDSGTYPGRLPQAAVSCRVVREAGGLRRVHLATPVWRWPSSDLAEQSDIVSARPVLDHSTVDNPPYVDVGPRDVGTGGLDASQQRHRRRPMTTADRHVVGD
jgi:hypothetical protein